jgi:hypothetical protein
MRRKPDEALLIAYGERHGVMREKLDCDTSFISRWKHRFLAECLAGLYSRHAGRVAYSTG